jgi:hypothetical protein
MRRLALALAPIASVALTTLASAPALADCVPGTLFCASAGVGVPAVQMGGQVSVGAPTAPPTAPPPVYVYAPPPPPAYGYAPPPPAYAPMPRRVAPYHGVGHLALDIHGDGAMGFGPGPEHNVFGMGGVGLGLRYHALPHFGFEAGVDFLGGQNYQGRSTTDFSGNAGALVYFNPRSRAQFYLSGGLVVDHSRSGSPSDLPPGENLAIAPASYTHVGGYAGLGLELFATRRLAFHFDLRGVVRENVSNGGPEFTDPSTGRTTNTSGGLVGQAGVLFYF